MKQFKVKVSDLLKEPGKTDFIEFDGLVTEQVQNLHKDGIKGNVSFQSLSEDSIMVTLENIKCKIHNTCDRCLEEFVREVHVEEYSAKFIVPQLLDEEQDREDELFAVDIKNEAIDLEDMVSHSILLQEPVSIKCDNCQQNQIEQYDDDDEEEYFVSNSNIVFS